MKQKISYKKLQCSRSLLIVILVAVTLGVLPMSQAADKSVGYILVNQEKDFIQVTSDKAKEMLFKSVGVSYSIYPPGSRRLTQRSYIDHSNGTIVNNIEHESSKVLDYWRREFQVQDFLGNLPQITVDVTLTAVYTNNSEEQVLNETYNLDLSTP